MWSRTADINGNMMGLLDVTMTYTDAYLNKSMTLLPLRYLETANASLARLMVKFAMLSSP